ncbi:MAG: methylthioribulose 1-phosphate dehydratase, partial [Gammaproteobacteria bacterium]|nr:methylthioribulose 1-phosphate dehydratase [Gammaproteobacteria bacterium]
KVTARSPTPLSVRSFIDVIPLPVPLSVTVGLIDVPDGCIGRVNVSKELELLEMLIDAEGISLDGQTSSAETGLHTALYRRFQKVGSVLHPHSPGATLLSRLRKDEVVLENYELLKAFDGINTHATRIRIPIFDNDQDIPRLQRAVDAWLDREPDPHAYIIRSHGFYTWGATIKDALRQVEALEYLLDIESRLLGATPA